MVAWGIVLMAFARARFRAIPDVRVCYQRARALVDVERCSLYEIYGGSQSPPGGWGVDGVMFLEQILRFSLRFVWFVSYCISYPVVHVHLVYSTHQQRTAQRRQSNGVRAGAPVKRRLLKDSKSARLEHFTVSWRPSWSIGVVLAMAFSYCIKYQARLTPRRESVLGNFH